MNASPQPSEPLYPFAQLPANGETIEVAPGIGWLRLVLPFALDHVNVWFLEDTEGVTAIDTGVADASTRAIWARLLPKARITRLLVTHFHPDHMGLAGWLAATTGAGLWTSRTEWLMARSLALDDGAPPREVAAAFYRRAGLDEEVAAALARHATAYPPRVVLPPPTFRRIVDGDEIIIGGRRWGVIIGRGHAPEHISLCCPELNVLIAGDQILPRISPLIGVWPAEPEADPLGDFLASLKRFRRLPADCLVLPSHGLPFVGVHARLDALVRHHDERLARLLACCAEPRTAAEAAGCLFERELDCTDQTLFAVAETLAHLNLLRRRGWMERKRDSRGRYVYRSVGTRPLRRLP